MIQPLRHAGLEGLRLSLSARQAAVILGDRGTLAKVRTPILGVPCGGRRQAEREWPLGGLASIWAPSPIPPFPPELGVAAGFGGNGGIGGRKPGATSPRRIARHAVIPSIPSVRVER